MNILKTNGYRLRMAIGFCKTKCCINQIRNDAAAGNSAWAKTYD